MSTRSTGPNDWTNEQLRMLIANLILRVGALEHIMIANGMLTQEQLDSLNPEDLLAEIEAQRPKDRGIDAPT